MNLKMQDISKYKIGMRTIKTGISVAVSLWIAQLFNLKNPSFVGIAAIVSMQSTVNESFVVGKNRMLGTFVGAGVGLLFSYFLPHNYFFLALGIIVVIHIHNLFDWKKPLALSAIVFLAIFLYKESNTVSYALHRLLDTFIGIIVSMLINYFVAAPHNKQSFIYIRDHIYKVLKNLIYDIITNFNQNDNQLFIEQLDEYNKAFISLKNDLSTDPIKGSSSKLALDIVKILENAEKNLWIVLELNLIPILNEKNKALFQELYSEEYNAPDRESGDIDIIYNYHINKVFNKLLTIEKKLS